MQFEAAGARALDTARHAGAPYAEIRFETARTERTEVRNGEVTELSDATTQGYGVRAFCDGAWGFASSADFSDGGLDATAALAVTIAKAGAAVVRRKLGDVTPQAYTDRYVTPVEVDPATISVGERVAQLLEAERLVHAGPAVRAGRAWIDLWHTDKEFYNTVGSKIEQTIVQTGSGLWVLAVSADDAQDRTFPGDVGLYMGGGWEIVELAKLRENAQRLGEEAIALLDAPQCPAGTMDVILGSSQVSLQIHESCGHAAELDRIMGWEANFSGTSFLSVEELGTLKYGSEHVSIVIDNALPRGLATMGYDDEGTKSGQSDIIRDGMLVGFEMSRETAAVIGRTSNGCVRAQSWRDVPMIRMCNLNLLPGTTPFEGLFDGVREGVYMESNRSWSIDDHRLNFQFGCEIGWEVKNGKKGRMLKNPTYAGVTPQFWNACDAVADERSWVPWGTPNCGKGEPMQTGRTAQAAAPARFRNIAVGVGYAG